MVGMVSIQSPTIPTIKGAVMTNEQFLAEFKKILEHAAKDVSRDGKGPDWQRGLRMGVNLSIGALEGLLAKRSPPPVR